MNLSNFFRVLEYILLPHVEKHFPFNKNQFNHQPETGCINAITFSEETVIYYILKRSDVYRAVVVLSKAYD